jgi:hypothetical protein
MPHLAHVGQAIANLVMFSVSCSLGVLAGADPTCRLRRLIAERQRLVVAVTSNTKKLHELVLLTLKPETQCHRSFC